jgi:hypothetical protein
MNPCQQSNPGGGITVEFVIVDGQLVMASGGCEVATGAVVGTSAAFFAGAIATGVFFYGGAAPVALATAKWTFGAFGAAATAAVALAVCLKM